MSRAPLAAAAAFFALSLAAGAGMRRAHDARWPSLRGAGGPFVFQDAALAASGFRAAAADLAWIQLLQYAAGSLPEAGEDRPGRPYDRLAELSLRVVRLDPSLERAVLFGAGILGWFRGVERPEEAAELLHEGTRLSPGRPTYALYLAALAYKQKGESARMIELLESSFERPETPSQMKTILANLRQSRGELEASLRLWERILAEPRDASEHPRARLKIAELRTRLKSRR